MPWFRSVRRKPVGRRAGGEEWSWSWEPETLPRQWRPWRLLGAAILGAVVLAVGLTLGFTLSDGGEEERPAAANQGGGEEAPSLVDLAGAISVSLRDGSAPEGGLFVKRCEVYLATRRTELAHPLPDGDYVFQVTDITGRVLLSTDEAKLRQVRIVDGFLRRVSIEGCHSMGSDSVSDGTTVQLCPFDESPNASGTYQLWLTPIEDFQGDLEAVGSEAGDSYGFLLKRSLVVVFGVAPQG